MHNTLYPRELVVGVLGGMGPQATTDFLSKLIAATPIRSEQDHLHVLLDVNPKVPDRNLAIAAARHDPEPVANGPGAVLASMAQRLEAAGATLLVMACNTAHAFEADIRACTGIPFVSMIEEACDQTAQFTKHSDRRIGVLAAQGCIDAGLYQRALSRRGLEPLLPTSAQQQRFMQLLYRIKLGDMSRKVRADMLSLAKSLVANGADAIIAGCTEVPLVLQVGAISRPLIDATANLALRCVRYARHLEPLPKHCFALSGD
jgi:aspartate racemase